MRHLVFAITLVVVDLVACNNKPPVTPAPVCDDPQSAICPDAAGGCCPPNYVCVPDACEFYGPVPIEDMKLRIERRR